MRSEACPRASNMASSSGERSEGGQKYLGGGMEDRGRREVKGGKGRAKGDNGR